MRVSNAGGTSGSNCKCGSWFDHWKKHSGQSRANCSVINCNSKCEVGAHVKKYDSFDRSLYIIPLCQDCNMASGSLEIDNSVKLVSANVNETCGKSGFRYL